MKMKPVIIVILAVGILSGCKERQVTIESEAKQTIGFGDAQSSVLGEKGWITTFASREGKLEGMDSDSEISFHDEGIVRMAEYGYAPSYYSGTYAVDDGGVITVSFKDYPGQWPKMIMREVSGRILLFRFDGAKELEFGGRGGAVETAEMKPFWPFGIKELSWEQPKPAAEPSNGDSGVFPILPGLDGVLPILPDLELDKDESRASDPLPERNEE